MMIKARLAFAFLCLAWLFPLRAFNWETATSSGREYVTLRSFCTFYGFYYQAPAGNGYFRSRSTSHTVVLKVGANDLYLDNVHYVMSFPVEDGGRDWLVSRMDVIKLFDPVLRPTEISGRHSIRGVVIDAGHGGTDNGAVSARGGAEKNYTLDTAFRLEAIFRSLGLKTVLTRRTDVFVDLYERAHIASLYSDYAFVSIHFNSAEAEARGLETYCLSPRGAASTSSAYVTRSDIQKLPGNDYDAFNALLASMVHSEIIRLNPGDATADRGVKRARFVVIKQNVLPAILVEGGFVSNRMEAARINSSDYRQRLAQAIARGVVNFINVMGNKRLVLPDSGSPTSPPAVAPARPATPPAPSGLANDPANGTSGASIRKSSSKASSAPRLSSSAPSGPIASSPAPSAPVTPKTKVKKSKKIASKTKNAPVQGPAAAPVAAASEASTNSPSSTPPPSPNKETPPASGAEVPPMAATPSSSLNLAEPTNVAPSAGAEKAPPEPDEPPVAPASKAPETNAVPVAPVPEAATSSPSSAPRGEASATNGASAATPSGPTGSP